MNEQEQFIDDCISTGKCVACDLPQFAVLAIESALMSHCDSTARIVIREILKLL